jgi:asparagine synthase (glutamine-hydrolysing)
MAMSLTGGLDGRIIMALARAAPGSLPCYTFGGTYRDCADVRIARRVAALCSQPHRTISVDERFIGQFPALAAKTVYVSDGTMDVSGAVELYVNRAARAVAPIRMTGNYGSEILRGNVAFRPADVSPTPLTEPFRRLIHEAAEQYAIERRAHPLTFIAFKQVPWFHYARFAVEQSQLALHLPYLDNDLVALAYRAPSPSPGPGDPSLRLIGAHSPALARLPTDRGLSSASCATVRFRRAWQSFTAKAEYAYDYGMPGWLATIDHALGPLHLERLFLGRHKFYHFRVWYRDRLAGYAKDVLLDPRSRSRPYLDGAALERVLDQHARGTMNHTTQIHRLLSAELTQRLLLEQ